jgi:hypothetical protein
MDLTYSRAACVNLKGRPVISGMAVFVPVQAALRKSWAVRLPLEGGIIR